jgi:acyl-CoA reductase-like NAD-dependent aldehyde dehydrogenase
VISFRNEEQAIRIANSTIYGLSAIIWTTDVARAHRLVLGVRAGSIVVNASANPTGGPVDAAIPSGGLKQSGIGVEGGFEGLETYTNQSAVQIFV